MGVMAVAPRTAAGRVLALGGAGYGCGALAVVLAARVARLAGQLAAARADDLVELGVLAVGVAVLVWLAVSAGVTAACLVARDAGHAWHRGESWAHRFAPGVIRRALVVVVATGLGTATVTSASAADLPPTTSPTAAATVAADRAGPDLGWVVSDGTATAPARPPAPRVPVEETDATVVVVRGDTLWDIAARHLPADATDAQVAAAWPAWYTANAGTIGPDPGRILPGQVLVVPAEAAR